MHMSVYVCVCMPVCGCLVSGYLCVCVRQCGEGGGRERAHKKKSTSQDSIYAPILNSASEVESNKIILLN